MRTHVYAQLLSHTVEVLVEILQYLPTIKDVVRCGLVNRQWQSVTMTEPVWKHIYRSHFGPPSSVQRGKNNMVFPALLLSSPPPQRPSSSPHPPYPQGEWTVSWRTLVLQYIKRFNKLRVGARVDWACTDNLSVLLTRILLYSISSIPNFRYLKLELPSYLLRSFCSGCNH